MPLNPSEGGESCGMNPFAIMPDACTFIDQQTFKLQESPEMVPTGEMPRNIVLSVDRNLVDTVRKPTDLGLLLLLLLL